VIVTKTKIEGLLILEPEVYGDERGYFFESFNENAWKELVGFVPNFVQDNESMSSKDVLRGIHFQNPPDEQGKLVRVIKGSVIDVAVDLRKNSPTYGSYEKILLSGKNKKQFYVPAGFGHGFLTLEDDTVFSYKCTAYYNPKNEGGILWNDPELNINWGVDNPTVSEKDSDQQKFSNFATPF
jgi:dTDP-4-dehydrorhamnose 3,5-epimerase